MANGGPQLVPPEVAAKQHPVLEKAGGLADLVFGKVKQLVGSDPELRAYKDLAERYVRDFAEKGFASMTRQLSAADRKYLGELLGAVDLPEAFRDGIIAKFEQAHPRLTYEEGAAVLRAVYGSENIASAEKQAVSRFLTFLENSKLFEGLFKTEQGMHTLVGLGLLEVKIPESATKLEGIVGVKFLDTITVTRGAAFLAKLKQTLIPAETGTNAEEVERARRVYAEFVDEFIKTNNDPRKIEQLVAKYFTSGTPSEVENAMKGLADSLIISEEASVIKQDLEKLMEELKSAKVDEATKSRVKKVFDDLIRRRPKSDAGGRFEAYKTAVNEAVEEARRLLKPAGVLNVQVEAAKKVLDLLNKYKTSAACASVLDQLGVTADVVKQIIENAEARAKHLADMEGTLSDKQIGGAFKSAWLGIYWNDKLKKPRAFFRGSAFLGKGVKDFVWKRKVGLALVFAAAGTLAYQYYWGTWSESRKEAEKEAAMQVSYEQKRREELAGLLKNSNVQLFRGVLSLQDQRFIEEDYPELAISLYRKLNAQPDLEGSYDSSDVNEIIGVYKTYGARRNDTIGVIRRDIEVGVQRDTQAAAKAEAAERKASEQGPDPVELLEAATKPLLPNEERKRQERVEEVKARLQKEGYQFVAGKEAEAEKFLYKNLGQGNFVDTFIPGAEKNKLIEKIPEPEITELDDGQEKSVSDFEQIANIVIPQDRRVEFFNEFKEQLKTLKRNDSGALIMDGGIAEILTPAGKKGMITAKD